MRTIKFRIFNKKEWSWLHDTNHAVNLFGETILFGDILLQPGDSYVDIKDLNELVAMQFTGVISNIGISIFEGDIVRVDEYYEGDHLVKEFIGEVVFDLGEFYIRTRADKYSYCEISRPLDVLGNIYDNPELLTT